MLKNYFVISLRNILKYKAFSLINILGLSIGIAVFLIIALFVKDEFEYDTFNEKADQIYRVSTDIKIGDNEFKIGNTAVPLAQALQDEFPEVVKTTRLLDEVTFLKKENEGIREEHFFYADSTVFEVFTFDFIHGHAATALNNPNKIVLTRSTAEKYFGSTDVLDKTLRTIDGKEFFVTGVVENLSQNSHFDIDFLASIYSNQVHKDEEWLSNSVHTYIMLPENYDYKILGSRFPAFVEKYAGPSIKQGMGADYQQFTEAGNRFMYFLQPLLSIHFTPNIYNQFKESGDINTVYIFAAIAVFILIIACVNFINLSTARSIKRANEVGVRKVLGSSKSHLVKQFLIESVIISFISILISVILVEVFNPFINSLTGKEISIGYLEEIYVLPGLFLFSVFIGLLAGSYPAILLSSFNPISVLKGKVFKGSTGSRLRKGLVVFQFVITIVLFTGTFVIYNQMEFMKNKNLGYEKEQVLVIQNANELGDSQEAFKKEMQRSSEVFNAAYSNCLPLYRLELGVYNKLGEDKRNYSFITIAADYDFIDTYKFNVKDGRKFDEKFGNERNSIILNETAARELGYKDPVNQKLVVLSDENEETQLNIIGMLEDFHLTSLHEKIRPTALLLRDSAEVRFFSIKLSTANIQGTVDFIKEKWKEFVPGKPIEYSFFDEHFDDSYEAELQSSKLFTSFSVLAIFIACLGLFGLTTFTAEQRTKEIGIRKVLGSSAAQIFILLSKEFIKWVVAANLVAWPVSYYLMNNWLQNFAYRTEIGYFVFIYSAVVSFVVALITVSFQSLKAAFANPVNSLKYE
ncbi:MAG: ABC transporter permease [Ignavibacteria bacterium]|jgi:putative ABC transport system permease protein